MEALRKAREMEQKSVDHLDRALTMKQLARDARELSEYLKDCELEQRDVRLETEALGADDDVHSTLRNQQEVLARAATQLKEIVALIQEADPVEPLLTEAEQAMTEATSHLGEGQALNSVHLQRQGENALRRAREMVARFADRVEYLAEWMEQLEQQRSAAMDLLLG